MDQIEFGIGQHAVHIGVTIVFWHIVVLAEFGEPICRCIGQSSKGDTLQLAQNRRVTSFCNASTANDPSS